MAIFMQVTGMQGNANAQSYSQQIPVRNVKQGIQVNVNNKVGHGDNRVNGQPTILPTIVEIEMDNTWPNWVKTISTGTNIQKVLISFTDSGNAAAYATIELDDVIVGDYSLSPILDENGQPETDKRPVMTLALYENSFINTFTPRAANNAAGTPNRAGFNKTTIVAQ